jgi:acyl-CoA thioester hydrolase
MEIKIYYQDTDWGGVVYYANYLTYFERARTEWLEERGVFIKELCARDIMFVISHAEVDYRTPARYGETIKISVTAEKISGVQTALSYVVEEKTAGRLIATGKTTMVCVGMDMKPKRIPEDVKCKMAAER